MSDEGVKEPYVAPDWEELKKDLAYKQRVADLLTASVDGRQDAIITRHRGEMSQWMSENANEIEQANDALSVPD